ncbi:hypothetical protein [Paenibacillus mucilaginosus]|uniref:hypothetical protein n=1 Tax=Paenibacillus mucilaginosus TaxID=61624 RepID=UPI0030832221
MQVTEAAGGFTGVIIAMYATGSGAWSTSPAHFRHSRILQNCKVDVRQIDSLGQPGRIILEQIKIEIFYKENRDEAVRTVAFFVKHRLVCINSPIKKRTA